jgi:hypothetical protein
MFTHSIRVAVAGVVGALALSTAAAAPAFAKDGRVERRGSCSGASDWKLKLQPEHGRVEAEFEVDSNRVGQVWRVAINDNGVRVFTGSRTTVAPSGSFEVRRLIANRAGADHVVASAHNAKTGETCTGRLTI